MAMNGGRIASWHARGLLAAGLVALAALCVQRARANDFAVYSPHVVQGQKEIELRGYDYRDNGTALNGTGADEMSMAYGVTRWWKTELYAGRFAHGQDGVTRFAGYEFENTFQFADAGEYWADPGFVLSYVHNKLPGVPSSAEFGPLFEKWSGRVMQRLNLIWERQVGGQTSGKYALRTAYSAGYKFQPALVAGVELYHRPADHADQIGPALSGEWLSAQGRELGYSLAMLYGVNRGAPQRTLVFRLEYGFF